MRHVSRMYCCVAVSPCLVASSKSGSIILILRRPEKVGGGRQRMEAAIEANVPAYNRLYIGADRYCCCRHPSPPAGRSAGVRAAKAVKQVAVDEARPTRAALRMTMDDLAPDRCLTMHSFWFRYLVFGPSWNTSGSACSLRLTTSVIGCRPSGACGPLKCCSLS